jgi:hypothetical protein
MGRGFDSNSPLQISRLKLRRDLSGEQREQKENSRPYGERESGMTGLEATYRAAREEHTREAGSHWCDVPQQKFGSMSCFC